MMKFRLTTTQVIIISLVIFLITNLFIWTSIVQRISVHRQNVTELENARANNRLDRAESRLQALYNVSKKNVLFLAELIDLENSWNSTESIASQQMAEFLKVDENYFQARFIDMSGRESIRVERIGDSVVIIPPEALQDKRNRYYFNQTIELDKGEVFVSQMDLNMEEGQIEKPYRPTVRFFTPVFKGETEIGIFGLNLNVKNWFDTPNGTKVGVLNSKNEGYFGTENLYRKFEADLTLKDGHGYPEYFTKKISLEKGQEWTLFARPNNVALDAKMKKFKAEAYKTGIILSAEVLFLLVIVQILHTKNRNISKLNRAVEHRLNERDILIKEIHHRVKNNLQVVASLLSLQSSFIKDEKMKMLFRYSQYRINSMGIVHEMLYKSNDLNRIDYGAYIKELVQTLIVSMKGNKSKIQLVTDVNEIYLNIDTSIPLGLIINEIITNSLKYGFPDREEGTITVSMSKLSAFSYKLNIGDNGTGIPDHINFRNTKSLGLKLIHKLALQLKGNIEKDSSKTGTNYIITFQEIEQTS
ncbi:MAG: sensor histidine kinase [Pricia sp.]